MDVEGIRDLIADWEKANDKFAAYWESILRLTDVDTESRVRFAVQQFNEQAQRDQRAGLEGRIEDALRKG